MDITQKITLDLDRRSVYTAICAKQGDEKSRKVQITLVSGGAVYKAPSGAQAKFRAQKPDGTMVLNPAVLNSDGTVTVELTRQTIAVPGEVTADVYLTDSTGSVLSSASFVIHVEPAPAGVQTDSENEFLHLVALVERAESASVTAGQQAQAAAASAQQAKAAERSATQIVQAAATHAGRRDNPHGVTATQVGAATSAALNAHTGNRSNPHGVTAAQIGAAPAGFGLGTTTRRVSDLVDNLDDLNVNGWFSKWSGDSVANCPCEYAIIMSLVYDSGHNLQFCFNMSSREMLRRVKSTNRWDMWEYINPSMEPGVEYLTTERYMRKPVYTKLVNLGTLPGVAGGKRINHGAAANQIIRVTGASSDGHAIPYRYGPESPMIWIGATETQVVVVTANRADADYSKLTGTAQIWYTK